MCFNMVPGAGIEPARLFTARDFLTTIVFTTRLLCLWSGLYLNHSISTLGFCRLVSTPSHYWAWLGISILQPSPNLTDSTSIVSNRALKFSISPLCLPISPSGQCGGPNWTRTSNLSIMLTTIVFTTSFLFVVWTMPSSSLSH